MLFDRGDEALDRDVDAEVVHVVAADLEHHHDDILADFVDVAMHGADDDCAALRCLRAGGDAWFELRGDALHDLAAHDELWYEDLLAGESLAQSGHRGAGFVQDRPGGFARVKAVLHDLESAVLVHGEDGVG